jgi:hypothetical protein
LKFLSRHRVMCGGRSCLPLFPLFTPSLFRPLPSRLFCTAHRQPCCNIRTTVNRSLRNRSLVGLFVSTRSTLCHRDLIRQQSRPCPLCLLRARCGRILTFTMSYRSLRRIEADAAASDSIHSRGEVPPLLDTPGAHEIKRPRLGCILNDGNSLGNNDPGRPRQQNQHSLH